MIEAAGLTRDFGTTRALDGLSFQVEPGEIVGFLGPNGAGKTTTMRILTCTLPPTSGRASVGGRDVVSEPDAVRSRIGFMPENVPLYPDLTVDEMLRFVADLKNVAGDVRAAMLDGVVERVGIGGVRRRLIGNLSKGYRQRVGLAQALVGDPDILILDEPTVGLDPHQIVEIRELIRGFRGEKTVLLSSHILNEISLICGRVLILDHGRLRAEADPAALAGGRSEGRRVRLEWEGPGAAVREVLAAVPGVVSVTPDPEGAEVALAADAADPRPELAAAVMAAGGRLRQMRDVEATLEELFLRLTGKGDGIEPTREDRS